MLAFISAASTFIGQNIKWIAIILMTGTIVIGATKLNNLIAENATNKIIISNLEGQLAYKQLTIDLLNKQIVLTEELVAARDFEVKKLDEQLENITDELPQDEADQAPLSTKEFFNRMRGL